MKSRPRAIVILSILVGYVLLQFIWWEILLVRQTVALTQEREKLAALSLPGTTDLQNEIERLRNRKTNQVLMIVGEGTVFLLLLLYGISRIRKAQEKEVALTARQNNFFLSVTHELKTPIAAMKLQLQTLRKPGLEAQAQAELISGALSENERLNALINNILLASRLDAGGMNLNPEKTDLASLTRDIVERYYRSQLSAGTVVLDSAGIAEARVDRGAYTSMLTNLVDNALKYSGSSPKVKIGVATAQGRTVVSVADNGPGIDASEKKRIFERFYRTGAEETRQSKGTGLGLYIVANLAAGHGARVEVSDNQPTGAIFAITFDARK